MMYGDFVSREVARMFLIPEGILFAALFLLVVCFALTSLDRLLAPLTVW